LATTPPKKSSFKTYVYSFTVLAFTGYAGATWYSQNDREFKRFFRDNVPLGSECLKLYKKINGAPVPEANPSLQRQVTIKEAKKEDATVENGEKKDDKEKNESEKKDDKEKNESEKKEKSDEKPKPDLPLVTKLTPAISTRLKVIIDEFKAFLQGTNTLEQSENLIKRLREELLQVENELIITPNKEVSALVDLVKLQLDLNEKFQKNEATHIAELQAKLSAEKTAEVEEQIKKYDEEAQKNLENYVQIKKQEFESEWKRNARKYLNEERRQRLKKLEELELKLKFLEQKSLESNQFTSLLTVLNEVQIIQGTIRNVINSTSKTSFYDALKVLKENSQENPLLKQVSESISDDLARKGVFSVERLTNDFISLKSKIRSVAFVPMNSTLRSHVFSWILSKFTLHPTGLVQGSDVESVLSRTEFWLLKGNLDMATRELNCLDGWPRQMALEWIQDARSHLEVKQALDVIDNTITMMKLGAI
jgi:hypothetical protein